MLFGSNIQAQEKCGDTSEIRLQFRPVSTYHLSFCPFWLSLSQGAQNVDFHPTPLA